MKHLSSIIQYEFLKPIEELLNMKSGIYIFYCSRKNTPYFFTAYFNKDKGLAMLSWNRVWTNGYSQDFINNITNFLYDFSYDTLDKLKQDNIEYYCELNTYDHYFSQYNNC